MKTLTIGDRIALVTHLRSRASHPDYGLVPTSWTAEALARATGLALESVEHYLRTLRVRGRLSARRARRSGELLYRVKEVAA